MVRVAIGAVWAAYFLIVGTCIARAETCIASHYGHGDGLNGSRTASGERFNTMAMTAAHRTLRFGTRVRVSRGGASVVVRITDRGPWIKNRCIDLSWAAAKAIGINGTGHVILERLP